MLTTTPFLIPLPLSCIQYRPRSQLHPSLPNFSSPLPFPKASYDDFHYSFSKFQTDLEETARLQVRCIYYVDEWRQLRLGSTVPRLLLPCDDLVLFSSTCRRNGLLLNTTSFIYTRQYKIKAEWIGDRRFMVRVLPIHSMITQLHFRERRNRKEACSVQ